MRQRALIATQTGVYRHREMIKGPQNDGTFDIIMEILNKCLDDGVCFNKDMVMQALKGK